MMKIKMIGGMTYQLIWTTGFNKKLSVATEQNEIKKDGIIRIIRSVTFMVSTDEYNFIMKRDRIITSVIKRYMIHSSVIRPISGHSGIPGINAINSLNVKTEIIMSVMMILIAPVVVLTLYMMLSPRLIDTSRYGFLP